MGKKLKVTYIIIFLAVCLLPFLFTFFRGSTAAGGENRRLAEAPTLVGESGLNTQVLAEVGAWYEDHFGLRSAMVTAQARLLDGLFGVSASDQMIDGIDDWLYYADSLHDFQGADQLSDRGIFCLAHDLSMLEQNLSLLGIRFVFAAAPNKNTLYPDNMPYYEKAQISDADNLSRLEAAMEREGVTFVSLAEVLQGVTDVSSEQDTSGGSGFTKTIDDTTNDTTNETTDEAINETINETIKAAGDAVLRADTSDAENSVGTNPAISESSGLAATSLLYHLRDSHWNNLGASLAAAALLDRIGQPHADWSAMNVEMTEDFVGDLESMLFPAAPKAETEYVYPGITDASFGEDEDSFAQPAAYQYLQPVDSNFDPMIETACADAAGSVVVFRDSFGNALLPFIASSYGSAYFTRGVPYQISDVYAHGADTVMIVRAQRFIPDLLDNPPVMEALPVFDEVLLARLTDEQDGEILTAVVSAPWQASESEAERVESENLKAEDIEAKKSEVKRVEAERAEAEKAGSEKSEAVRKDNIEENREAGKGIVHPQAVFSVTSNGYIQELRGEIAPALLAEDTRIFVQAADGLFYEAFLTTPMHDEAGSSYWVMDADPDMAAEAGDSDSDAAAEASATEAREATGYAASRDSDTRARQVRDGAEDASGFLLYLPPEKLPADTAELAVRLLRQSA